MNVYLQNTPFVIMKSLDVPKETLERMSFEEKYEGYVLDLVKHLSEEVSYVIQINYIFDHNMITLGDRNV